MNKSIIFVVVVMFALRLGAGVVAGKLSARTPTTPPTIEKGTLSEELKLTGDQQKQMQQIWEHMQAISQQCLEDAKKVQADQDKALSAMLTPEQLEKWSKITTQNANNIAVLDGKRKAALESAVKQTKSILNDSQREIYQQLIKSRLGPGGIQGISENIERF